ncbi:Protoheme IX farnesyltransferase [Commensalibacter sp. Nvir]|uniref:heme o synthase n=1 Tax=Commensalibacter sp. Nvir TaxID=3069817 RepID=UPI002D71059B|nr:Protoheme IX farnesyltransferase [Commensalibacter sp. Nvir]
MSEFPIEVPLKNRKMRYNSLIVGSEVKDWVALLKPRVISLVVFTSIAGIICAPGSIHPALAFISILCVCLASGGAGAINMWYDRDIDRIMLRTSTRPLPADRIRPLDALIYGVCICILSVMLIFLATNGLTAFILAFSIFFYTTIYTVWLKRTTTQNIVIGGAAGAFPPIIGWTSVTGHISLFPIILFLIIFLWTPPHFWSLSLYACKDYGRAGIPMLPVVKGEKFTRWNIFVYVFILAMVSLLPVYFGYTSYLYAIVVIVLNVGFLYRAICILTEEQTVKGISLNQNKAARNSFHYSLIYLFVLFLTLMIDHKI